MADGGRLSVKKEEDICTKRWGVESRGNPVTSWYTNGRTLLWNALDTNNFSFLLFNFSNFILILLSLFDFLMNDKEAHDTAVTCHVTWCDIIGLEHNRRI